MENNIFEGTIFASFQTPMKKLPASCVECYYGERYGAVGDVKCKLLEEYFTNNVKPPYKRRPDECPLTVKYKEDEPEARSFNIGFTSQDGEDETQFDIHKGESVYSTLFELFLAFLAENKLELKSLDYIEEVPYDGEVRPNS